MILSEVYFFNLIFDLRTSIFLAGVKNIIWMIKKYVQKTTQSPKSFIFSSKVGKNMVLKTKILRKKKIN